MSLVKEDHHKVSERQAYEDHHPVAHTDKHPVSHHNTKSKQPPPKAKKGGVGGAYNWGNEEDDLEGMAEGEREAQLELAAEREEQANSANVKLSATDAAGGSNATSAQS